MKNIVSNHDWIKYSNLGYLLIAAIVFSLLITWFIESIAEAFLMFS